MCNTLYNQNGVISELTAKIEQASKDIISLQTDVKGIKPSKDGDTLVRKDLEYIKDRLAIIENKLFR